MGKILISSQMICKYKNTVYMWNRKKRCSQMKFDIRYAQGKVTTDVSFSLSELHTHHTFQQIVQDYTCWKGLPKKYTVPFRETDPSLSILGGSSSHKKYGRMRDYFMKETKWPTNRITVKGGMIKNVLIRKNELLIAHVDKIS